MNRTFPPSMALDSELAPKTKIILISSFYTAAEAAALARSLVDGKFIQKCDTAKELTPTIIRLLEEKH